MLFLSFRIGKDRYAIDVAGISEVLPVIEIKALPRALAGIAGVMNYRGAPVPVVDLSSLMLGHLARPRLSTRIVVVQYSAGDGVPHHLGLIAEHATQTIRCDPADFTPSGVTNRDTPYLGPVIADAEGLIQRVEVSQLIPASIHDALFQQLAEAGDAG
jgi:chemotaxis-related protein WspB